MDSKLLPPVFRRNAPSIPANLMPSVVIRSGDSYRARAKEIARAHRKRAADTAASVEDAANLDMMPIILFDNFWVDYKITDLEDPDFALRMGLHNFVVRTDENTEWKIMVFHEGAGFLEEFSASDILSGLTANGPPSFEQSQDPDESSRVRKDIVMSVVTTLICLTASRDEIQDAVAAGDKKARKVSIPNVFVTKGSKPGFHYVRAKLDSLDGFSEERLDFSSTGAAAREDPSGSKKMEHGVRGHYRRYKSGKVAWIRPHVRGDNKLGTKIKIYDIDEG